MKKLIEAARPWVPWFTWPLAAILIAAFWINPVVGVCVSFVVAEIVLQYLLTNHTHFSCEPFSGMRLC